MKKAVLLYTFFIGCLGVFGQGNVLYTVVDEMPSFPGGNDSLAVFIRKNIHYPHSAVQHQIEGNVNLSFVIDTTGSIVDLTLMKGLGYGCDEEALRIVRMMPKWKPGKLNGKKVKVLFNTPFAFIFDQYLPRYVKNGRFIYRSDTLQPSWRHQLPFDVYIQSRMRKQLKQLDELVIEYEMTIDENGNLLECNYSKSIPKDYSKIKNYLLEIERILRSKKNLWRPLIIEGDQSAATYYHRFVYKRK